MCNEFNAFALTLAYVDMRKSEKKLNDGVTWQMQKLDKLTKTNSLKWKRSGSFCKSITNSATKTTSRSDAYKYITTKEHSFEKETMKIFKIKIFRILQAKILSTKLFYRKSCRYLFRCIKNKINICAGRGHALRDKYFRWKILVDQVERSIHI